MVQSLTSGIAWNSLSLRLKKGMAILCLAALTGANVQFEFQKFATPPLASAQTPSQCSDNVDNDGDGMVDMQDPGCSDPGDNSEFNIGGGNGGGNGGGGQSSVPPPPPAAICSDGIDNDGDGRTDYPSDPGCSSPNDNDEYNPPAAACSDGMDNDSDGLTDYPSDPGCSSPNDSDEYNAPTAICSDGIDNDGDGKTDYPQDPGCSSPNDNDEYNPPAAACSDGMDNDADGKVDYPQDPGCSSASDNDEYNAPAALCSDGIDNDGDGKVDYPQDPGCSSPNDNDEYNAPAAACSDGIDNDNDGKTDYPQDPGCSSSTDNDEYNAPAAACSDGIDNDNDGKVDYPQDPGCSSSTDNDEYNAPISSTPLPQCQDGVDNDGDGKVDYPQDPGCATPSDNDEFNIITIPSSSSSAAPLPQCMDGVDNDGDGKVDYPQDPGCATPSDNDEFNIPVPSSSSVGPLPQCRDGVDNDGDGKIDYPQDPGCATPDDNDEFNIPSSSSSTGPLPQCRDGVDNDGDGKVDYPQDPGCSTPDDNDEFNIPSSSSSSGPVPQCRDGVDNDGDGKVDYPQDPGCSNPNDDDEFNIPSSSSSTNPCIINPSLCPSSPSSSSTPPTNSDLSVSKSGPASVQRGNLAIYTLSITNAGPATAQNVFVTDAFPAGFIYNASASDGRCSLLGNQVRCSIGTMVPGTQNIVLSFTTPTVTPCAPINVFNTAIISTSNTDPNLSNNTSNTVVTNLTCPPGSSSSSSSSTPGTNDLSISKSGPSSVLRGTTAVYTLSVTNSGPATAQDVIVTDAYPAGFIYNGSASDGRCSLIGNQVRCFLGSMTPGTQNITLSFTVPTVTPCTTETVYNTAIVSTSSTDPNLSNNTSNTIATTMTCGGSSSSVPPQLGCINIQKFAYDSNGNAITPTPSFSFQIGNITVSNNANGVVSFLDVTPGLHTVTEVQTSGWTQINVTPANGVVNVVAGGNCASVTFTNIQNSIQQPHADISVQKVALASTVTPGDIARYNVIVRNNGPDSAQNVTVTDVIPAGLTFLAINSDPRCSAQGNTVVCNLGTLIANQTVTIGMPFVVPQVAQCGSTIINNVTINSSTQDPQPSNNQSSATISVACGSSSSSVSNQNADLAITKTANPTTLPVGNVTVFTITVTNAGPATAIGAFVNDTLPSGLTFVNAFMTRGTFNGNQWNIGDLSTGATAMLQIAARVDTVGTFTNTATVDSASPDTNRANNTASATVTGTQVQQTGCINILKQTYDTQGNPLSVIAQFLFNLDGGSTSTVNDLSGRAQFLNVPVGIHAVTEVVPQGWTQQSVFPQNGVVTVFGSANNQNCTTVTFQNKQVTGGSSSSAGTGDVSITKTVNPATVAVGSNTVFTITVYNNSNQSAQNVVVNDTLPSGLSYVSSVMTSGTYNGSQWNIGTLVANGSATMQLTARVNVNGAVTNTATVTTSSPDSNSGNNTASATVTGTQQNGCIDIYKTAIDANGNQIYQVPSFSFTLDNNRTVSNDSSGHARFDNVPAGTHTVSEYGMNGWRLVSMNPSNGSVNVTANGNCATVTLRNQQTNDNNNRNLTISKTDGRSRVHVGDRLRYTITVRNNNGIAVNNATVYDYVPNDLIVDHVSDNGSNNYNDYNDNYNRYHSDRNSRTIRWSNVYVPAYGTVTFWIDATVDDNADDVITNRAEVNGSVAYDTDTVDTDDNNNRDLELTKDASTSEVFPGGMIEYTITLRNSGNNTIQNIRVTDDLPYGVRVIDNGGADSYNNTQLSWRIGSLSRNASRTIRYRVSLTNVYTAGQLVRNNVRATADNGIDERASATVQVIGLLPQTGFMNADLTGGTAFLKPIINNAGNGSLPMVPFVSILALAGLATGAGAGFLRKFVIGI